MQIYRYRMFIDEESSWSQLWQITDHLLRIRIGRQTIHKCHQYQKNYGYIQILTVICGAPIALQSHLPGLPSELLALK